MQPPAHHHTQPQVHHYTQQPPAHHHTQPIARSSAPLNPAIIVLSSIILVSAITGLALDASGMPWVNEGEDYDYVSEKYNKYESKDWDECCEEEYEEYLDGDDDEQEALDTAVKVFSPLTLYFVLILIFSALCLIVSSAPIPSPIKLPLVTLMGLATATTGIFLTRKFAITAGFFLITQANLDPGQPTPSYMHVMIYFGGVLGILCLFLGAVVVGTLKSYLRRNNLPAKSTLSGASVLLNISLLVFLISPLIPIAYVSSDTDYVYYDEDEDSDGQYLFPTQIIIADDYLSASGGYDDDDMEIAESTFGNYVIVENLFFSMIWINLSVIMLAALSVVPKIGFVFEGLAQLNIITIVLMILALIFTIIMYVNLPDLLGDDGIYSEVRYDSFYFHVNWIFPIACILAILQWVILLIKSHIPWWKSLKYPAF